MPLSVSWNNFYPPTNLRELTLSMMTHTRARQALDFLKSLAPKEMSRLDLDNVFQTQQIEIGTDVDFCDRAEDSSFAYTRPHSDGRPRVSVSKALTDFFQMEMSEEDKACVGFMIAVSIAHELGHYAVRLVSDCTPQEVKDHEDVQDAGFLVERFLFQGLPLYGMGLTLFGSANSDKFKWFCQDLVLKGIRLGTERNRQSGWDLLTTDYVVECYSSGRFRPAIASDIEHTTKNPGVFVAREPSHEQLEQTSKDCSLQKAPFVFVAKRNCPNAAKNY